MELCIFARMLLDIKKDVLKELFLVLIVRILLTINKKGTIIWQRSMQLQLVAVDSLSFWRTRVPKLLLSSTTLEKGTWGKTTETQ